MSFSEADKAAVARLLTEEVCVSLAGTLDLDANPLTSASNRSWSCFDLFCVLVMIVLTSKKARKLEVFGLNLCDHNLF